MVGQSESSVGGGKLKWSVMRGGKHNEGCDIAGGVIGKKSPCRKKEEKRIEKMKIAR